MSGTSNGELVRWSFERLNEHDIDALRPYWTTETVERFPDRTCRGADEIADYFEAMIRAVENWHLRIVALVEDGPEVFARWHLTGVHRGELMGIAPTGRELSVDGVDHFTIRAGVIVSNFVISDQLAVARQLGMLPEDGSAPDRVLKRAFNVRTRLSPKLRLSRGRK
ncbi:MAG: ester cyclase [Acidobacteriota bacterium]|nr:ester cyclase [Acidobacteriota bacterium]